MSSPTLRQLEYAVSVADHEHFGRAAAASVVSQPGLSSQIQELERRLGVTLFERSNGPVRLTAAGTEVIERARRVLSEIDELVIAASMHDGVLRGTLRVAAIPTMAPYLVPSLVRTLRRVWPDVELHLQEMQTAALVDAVEKGDVDIGLLAIPIDTRSLHVETILEEPFLLALPEGHELSGSDPLPLKVLATLPVLLLEEGHCLRDHTLTACNLAGQVDHREIHAASLATLTQMVASGVGVTLLPSTAVSVEARPGTGIAVRPFQEPSPGRTIALAWRRTDPRATAFEAVTHPFRQQIEEVHTSLPQS
jgi:LysR family hydrogen peroxide-inducible transcriptional activator